MIENKFLQTEYQSRNLCNSWVATAIVGSAVVGAGVTAYSANKAAGAQKDAAGQSIATQKQMYDTTRGDLAPFRQTGIDASEELKSRLPFLTSPIVMDQNALEQTPGYQFTKTQGLKAVQNSAAARGLGVSGAALKGAANFATGLADNTYQTQFNLENTNRTNAFNRLKSLVDVGENAAALTGIVGSNAANQIGSAQIGQGNAQAAADNATGAAFARGANNVAGYATFKGIYGDKSPGVSTAQTQNGGTPMDISAPTWARNDANSYANWA